MYENEDMISGMYLSQTYSSRILIQNEIYYNAIKSSVDSNISYICYSIFRYIGKNLLITFLWTL